MDLRDTIRRLGTARLRLTDAVIIAAAALLLLKGVAFLQPAPPPAPVPAAPAGPPPSVVVPDTDLPSFARVLAYARADRPRPEVVTTGSNPGEEGAADPAAPALASAVDGFGPALAPSGAPASPSQAALLERMAAQREELDRRLRELDMREELVAAAERQLQERGLPAPGAPGAASGPGGGAAAGTTAPEPDASLARLVSMYQAMRPKDAARVFDRLALDVLVPLVEQMNPRTMAEVMALMSPESAERLTIALAMRARGLPLAGRSPATTQALPSTELPAIELPVRP